MGVLFVIMLIWFVGMILAQVVLRCGDFFQCRSDRDINMIATIIWPLTIFAVIVYWIWYGLFATITFFADCIVALVCPNKQ